jgi:hypothetical protein
VDNIKVEYGTPDIKLLDATCNVRTSNKISINYSISGNDVLKDFVFRAYLSTDEKFDVGDTPLSGEKNISDAKFRKAGRNGAEGLYIGKMTLPQPPPLSKTSRFVIVVADADNRIAESDENNNAMFVIPLFKKANSAGYELATPTNPMRKFVGNLAEWKAVRSIGSRFSRGTAEYRDRLGGTINNIHDRWVANGGSFREPTDKLFDKKPFEGDDWTVQRDLVTPLDEFMKLVNLAKAQQRLFATTIVYINEAFDEQGDHVDSSKHYEGRAIDFDCNNHGALNRLAGLALVAGFDWVNHEGDHVHVSHDGWVAFAKASSIVAALDWGYTTADPKLITSGQTYLDLKDPMDKIAKTMDQAEAEGRELTADEVDLIGGRLTSFIQTANKAQAGRNRTIVPGFAGQGRKMGLLVYNAKRIAEQLSVTL